MSAKSFKKMREEKHYSQVALAREFNVDVVTISRWERGAVPIPRIAELALRFLKPNAKAKGGK